MLTVTSGIHPERHRACCATARSPRSARTSRFPPAPRSSTPPASSCSPGIIDAHSHIANDAINEGSTTVSSMIGMEDVLDPDGHRTSTATWPAARPTANILHGSANPIGGKTLVIKLRWGKTRGERPHVRRRDARHQVRARREPEGHGGRRRPAQGRGRYPTTRMGVEYVIRDAFTRAKAYQKAWEDYEQRKRRERPTVVAAAPRPAARAARRGARRQAPRARALAIAPTRS